MFFYQEIKIHFDIFGHHSFMVPILKCLVIKKGFQQIILFMISQNFLNLNHHLTCRHVYSSVLRALTNLSFQVKVNTNRVFEIILRVLQKLNSGKTLETPSYCNRSNPIEMSEYLYCFDETSSIIRHKVHVSVRKSQGPNCLGPFKGPQAPYNGRKTLVELC